MKKLFLIVAALFAAVSFNACSDDDDNNVDWSQLYGTWQEVRSYGYALENGQKVDEWDETLEEESLYSFNKNGGGSYHNPVVDRDIHYTQNGNRLQLTYTGMGETFSRTWTIEELTDTRMVATEYSSVTLEGGVIYEEYDTMVFKRVN